MKKLIFCKGNFLGSGHFLIPEILKNDQKLTGAQNVTFTKNQFFHTRQPPEIFFEFCSCSGFIFMTDFCNFTRLLLNFVTSEAVLI